MVKVAEFAFETGARDLNLIGTTLILLGLLLALAERVSSRSRELESQAHTDPLLGWTEKLAEDHHYVILDFAAGARGPVVHSEGLTGGFFHLKDADVRIYREAFVDLRRRALTELALDGIGREFFATTVCGDEVPQGKPAPDEPPVVAPPPPEAAPDVTALVDVVLEKKGR